MARLSIVCAFALVALTCQQAHGSRPVIQNLAEPASWTPPSFCRDLDCPPYVNQRLDIQGVELRSYQPGIWVSTVISGTSYDAAVRTGFQRLFDYISGGNANGQKIEMTAPVRVQLSPGSQGQPCCGDKFTVSFYMPKDFQSGARQPPAPSNANVFIDRSPAATFYVSSYGGFNSVSLIQQKAADMLARLDQAQAPYDASSFYSAGYDAPFRLTDRHNELWIPAKL